jgi:hypothetical protein
VFEHLDEPHAAASRRLAGLLVPAGRTVLIYPNPVGLGARLFRSLWTEWDPPRHLVMSPLSAICKAASPKRPSPRQWSDCNGGVSVDLHGLGAVGRGWLRPTHR